MAIEDKYQVFTTPSSFAYAFKSEGVKGVIWKAVVFQKEKEANRYNLAFGDIVGNDLDDKIVSNNHDLKKVISTVISIIYLFWEKTPNAIIEIYGVDEKRLNLYNIIIRRRQSEISKIVDILVLKDGKYVEYDPSQFY